MMYQGELWEVPETGTYYLVFLTVILVSSVLLLISWLFVKDQPEKYVRDETESVKGFI